MNINQLLGNRVIDGILDPVTAPISAWLDAHPIMNWLVTHPIWLIGVIVICILLFSGLIAAVGRLTERVWLAVFQTPFKLIQWAWRRGLNLSKAIILPMSNKSDLKQTSQQPQERLTDILNRLEAIRQEQDELLNEVKKLLVKGAS